MRKEKLTAEEILQAEKVADDRRQSRLRGFEKMKERDANFGFLRDYNGHAQEIRMFWGYGGKFKLEIHPYKKYGGTIDIVLDAEELRKHLRWV